ncbi:hypothetical protein O7627_26885 [Solwaraspora sp. WMMD1047]|uniref:hypothetical protein n=1 Tax=Solwaraspora sp. WMMD1047 TaxID=3016102 RepID=UPI002415AC86|nr:hypothetical protein [Solwaraspora sp. WMMD1047]MDG4832905.1 hypothetical protein [Solwaraspora sp. WMMD1047]
MARSVTRVGTALFITALLAACGGEEPGSGSSAVSTPPAAPSPTVAASTAPPPFTAEEVNDFGELCGSDEHRATPSRPYAGPGPHPIVVFGKDADHVDYQRDYLVSRDEAAFDPEDPADVSLLACITGAKTGKRVGTCRYQTDSGTKSVEVEGQRFTIDVFALDTGERVGRETFQADFCPPGLVTLGGGDVPKRMYSTMTIDHRAKTVDRYVTGPA